MTKCHFIALLLTYLFGRAIGKRRGQMGRPTRPVQTGLRTPPVCKEFALGPVRVFRCFLRPCGAFIRWGRFLREKATRRIRADAQFADLPIIAMTAHVLMQERQKAADAGMNDQISKPIDSQAMFETLRRYYRQGGTRAPRVTPAAAPTVPVAVPEIEGIDVNGGIRRVAGNRKLYLDLLRRYIEGERDSEERIRTALKSGDKALAERIAHTVKGVSGNIVAADAQAAAGKLEASIREDEPADRMEEALSRFSLAVGAVIANIRSALGEPAESHRASTDGQKLDSSALMQILQKLTRYAEESDSEALEYMDTRREEIASSLTRQDFDELETAVRAYDFAAALATLQRLTASLQGKGFTPGAA